MMIICHPSSGSEDILEENKINDPHLYEIRAPHSEKTHYLLGTQHDLPFDLLHEIARDISLRCDVLVTERMTDRLPCFGDYSWFTLEELVNEGMVGDQFIGWTHSLTEAQKKVLDAYVTTPLNTLWGISYESINPAMIFSQLQTWRKLKEWSQNRSVDYILRDFFCSQGKTVLGVESGKDRIQCQERFSMLRVKSADLPACVSELKIFLDQENSQNMNTTSCMNLVTREKTTQDFPLYFKDFLSSMPLYLGFDRVTNLRNILWIPRIQEHIEKYPDQIILFKFGVGHFYDIQYGIIKLLEKKGYHVKRVPKKGYSCLALSGAGVSSPLTRPF